MIPTTAGIAIAARIARIAITNEHGVPPFRMPFHKKFFIKKEVVYYDSPTETAR